MSETEKNQEKTGGSLSPSSPVHLVRELQHPERKLTILMISTALAFAFIGTSIGALTLAHLSGIPTTLGLGFFSAHPYLQIYGFLGEFVVGVAYSLLPRFKIVRVPKMALGYTTYGLLTIANILFLIMPELPLSLTSLGSLGALLFLGGAIIFAAQVFWLASHSGGGFPETNPLMVLSSLSLVMISVSLFLLEANVASIGGGDIFSPQFIFLSLLGFAGSMIYTVEIRSVSFRQCNYRKSIANLSWKFQATAICLTFVALFSPFDSSILPLVGGVLFFVAALSVIVSIRIFELAHPLMYKPAMTRMHFAIVRYNEVCLLSGSVWLIIGCAFGIVLMLQVSNVFSFFLRDSFIHSIAIGFIGSTIVLFALMLLPSLLGRKAPVSGLSFGPIALLDAGIILRVIGDFTTVFWVRSISTFLPIWESASGPLILGAMVWLAVSLPYIGRQRNHLVVAVPVIPQGSSVVDALGNERDAKITIVHEAMDERVTINVWFAVRDGNVFLLPSKGMRTRWYRDVLANPTLDLVIANKSFSGTCQALDKKSEVKAAIKLFKDKYGERVYENFYDGRVDRAVKVGSIQLRSRQQ